MQLPTPPLEGPIPGMSLTAEVGSRPWQNPPQYTTPEEALEFYLPRLTADDTYEELLNVMELGIPLTNIAEAMQSGGVMQGMHTIDVGILVMPVLIEMMAYIAEDAGIEYNMGIDAPIDDDKISHSAIALAMKKMRERIPEVVEEAKEEEPMDEEPVEQLTGLMARRA